MILKLNTKQDFQKAARLGRPFFIKEFGFKILPNHTQKNRYGIVVSLDVDKRAVVRNKIRRQFTQLIQLNEPQLKTGFDIMILTRSEVKNLNYQDMKKQLLFLFQKAGLIKK